MKTLLTLVFAFSTLIVFGQPKGSDYHLDKDYKISPTGKIDLRCSDAKVIVTGSDRTSAHVKIDREVVIKGWYIGHHEFSVDITEEEGNLKIKENASQSMTGIVGYYSEKYSIRLEVPQGASLTVQGDDGDYKVMNINGAISLSLDDADVELISCGGDYFRFNLDDGDVKMDQGKGTLEIDADDADVHIVNGDFKKIDADMDDGDFIIETALPNDGDYQIDVQDGLVSLYILDGGGKFDVRRDDANVTADNKFEMNEESDRRVRLSLGKGNASVMIHADDARVKLATR